MTARDRMVRVVTEALGSVVPNSDGVLWDFEHEDGQREPVTLTTAAEVVVAALEAASIHEAVEKMRSNMEMARATYSTGPVEPTGDISRARERIGKFARGGRIERGQARPIEDGYPLTCAGCGRHLPCRHCETQESEA